MLCFRFKDPTTVTASGLRCRPVQPSVDGAPRRMVVWRSLSVQAWSTSAAMYHRRSARRPHRLPCTVLITYSGLLSFSRRGTLLLHPWRSLLRVQTTTHLSWMCVGEQVAHRHLSRTTSDVVAVKPCRLTTPIIACFDS